MIRGVGSMTLLALLFIALKLGGLITWSWWWVLAPWWGPAALLTVAFVVALLFLAVTGGSDRQKPQ